VSAMLSCFAGGVLVAPLCGEPILAAFADGVKVFIATVLWFLIYYTPHDLTYHVRYPSVWILLAVDNGGQRYFYFRRYHF
jgi:hypothetical protein